MISALRTLLLCALAAVALYAMQHSTPYYSDITAPVVVKGKAGERVETTDFAFVAGDLQLARQVKVESFGGLKDYSTSGVWLIVEGAALAKTESMTLTKAEWQAKDGLRYELSQRFSTVPGYLPTERLEPGLARPVLLAFELPETAVQGGTLRVARSLVTPLSQQVSLALGEKEPKDIEPSITISRGSAAAPFKLAAR